METLLLKIPEVMARLAVGQTKVYELMSSGDLRSVKVGRARRVASDDLERSEVHSCCQGVCERTEKRFLAAGVAAPGGGTGDSQRRLSRASARLAAT